MIEVKIPKEIRSYQSGLLFGLSIRQTISMVLCAVINVPLYLLLYPRIGSDLAGWIVIVTTTPFAMVGFIKINGLPAEQAFLCMWHFFTKNQKCPYETDNIYHYIMEGKDEDENTKKGKRKETE